MRVLALYIYYFLAERKKKRFHQQQQVLKPSINEYENFLSLKY